MMATRRACADDARLLKDPFLGRNKVSEREGGETDLPHLWSLFVRILPRLHQASLNPPLMI